MKTAEMIRWTRADVLRSIPKIARLAVRDPATFADLRAGWSLLGVVDAAELDVLMAARQPEQGGAALTPFLSDAEIDELCAPLVMPAAQVRYLRNVLALHVQTKPNGRALVMRSEIERVLGAARFGEQAQNARVGPNVVGLAEWAKERKNGTQTSKR